MRSYRFDLICPRCKHREQITLTTQNIAAGMNCGGCLLRSVELVRLEVVSVTVLDGDQS